MITTYETKYRAWLCLQYGWKPDYKAYRIKDYSMRKVEHISTASLRRIEKLLEKTQLVCSDCGENWFKTIFKMTCKE